MAAPTAALGRIPARPPRAEAARFAAVYERHHQALYRYCRSIRRQDEDAQRYPAHEDPERVMEPGELRETPERDGQ